jgi:hypothetical protein
MVTVIDVGATGHAGSIVEVGTDAARSSASTGIDQSSTL